MTRAKTYLTFDDNPSPSADKLTDFLYQNNIPAIFFCRGKFIEENPGPIIRAIGKGMVIANHSYSHQPAGDIGVDAVMEEVERTEELIEMAYVEAQVKRHGYYFRFPYVDRGDGDRLERHFEDIIKGAETGKQIELHETAEGRKKVEAIQDFLKGAGFIQPFPEVNHPLYSHKEISDAADCFFTYTSGDWMLTARHKGKWAYKTQADLEKRMEDDPWLFKDGNTGISLFHDQEEIIDATIALVGYMKSREIEFLKF